MASLFETLYADPSDAGPDTLETIRAVTRDFSEQVLLPHGMIPAVDAWQRLFSRLGAEPEVIARAEAIPSVVNCRGLLAASTFIELVRTPASTEDKCDVASIFARTIVTNSHVTSPAVRQTYFASVIKLVEEDCSAMPDHYVGLESDYLRGIYDYPSPRLAHAVSRSKFGIKDKLTLLLPGTPDLATLPIFQDPV